MNTNVNEQSIKETIDKILSGREFSDKAQNDPILDAFSKMLKEIYEWIKEKIFGRFEGAFEKVLDNTNKSELPDIIIKIFFLVLLAIIVFFIIRFVINKIYISKKEKSEDISEILIKLKDPDEIRSKSLEYYKQGEYRLSLKFLYISILLSFDRSGLITIDKSKTNSQYLCEISKNCKRIYDNMRRFTHIFNGCIYGNKAISKEDLDFWMMEQEKILEEAKTIEKAD